MFDTNEMDYIQDDELLYSKIENVLLESIYLQLFYWHGNLYKIFLFVHKVANKSIHYLVHLDFL